MAECSDIISGFARVEGGVVAPLGFTASGVATGLKSGDKPDLALVAAEKPVPAAAVFTTNKVAAAPVQVSREHVAPGKARAIVLNAGNANACTGAKGVADARATAAAVARLLGCAEQEVLVASTGVIGVPLPLDLVLAGVPAAVAELDDADGVLAARAIMTTDTFAKQVAVTVPVHGCRYTMGGMAKGSGMIAPNMATMLAVLTTDAPLTAQACDTVLRSAVRTTFNRVTVDSDMSTNDTAVLMASGAAGGEIIDVDSPAFCLAAEAVHAVASELARMIARDGEGATKLITVRALCASTMRDAELVAFAVANSPLVKTAIFGRDANWGRVAAAAGRSGAKLDPDRLDIRLGGIDVCRSGTALPFDETAALAALARDEVEIEIDLNLGTEDATVWTCDLTCDYVRINGEYRS